VIKIASVVIPTSVLNIPITANHGDNADAYSFTIHKAGAGQRNLRKIGMLMSAAKLAKTVTSDRITNFIMSIGFDLFLKNQLAFDAVHPLKLRTAEKNEMTGALKWYDYFHLFGTQS
jgi:hypothetical protein